MRRKLIPFFLICLIHSISFSQDERLLTPFVKVISNLNPGESDIWQIPVLAGGLVSFQLTARTGDLAPAVILSDEVGNILLQREAEQQDGERNVLIEAFTIPYSSLYELAVISRETSGEYSLEVLPGFTRLKIVDITNAEIWRVAEDAQMVFSPDRISLSTTLEVPMVQAWMVDELWDASRKYIHTEIESIDSVQSWLVGMTMGADDGDYFSYSINQDGLWRFAHHHEGEIEILRSWQSHPVITAGLRSFSLGLLINGDVVELFYKGQFVDGIQDERLRRVGQLGLLAGYGEGFPVTSRVNFSRLAITEPQKNGEDFADFRFVPNARVDVLRSLVRAGLVPTQGELSSYLPEANWRAIQAGVSYFLLNDELLQDFVFAAALHWQSASPTLAGCGLIAGLLGEGDYYLAFIDNGGYGLSQRRGEAFLNASFVAREFNPQEKHHILLMMRSGELVYYLNGRYAGSIENATNLGNVAFAVLIHEEGLTQCRYEDAWLWRWN
ncbi:MAG: hypothetical protein OXG02_10195 [Chloroflexi bacterium]|nr:hypothetical protein [Chloroflexota bacterium]